MIDEKKIWNYIKEQINPYGKPFTGTAYEFGLKVMDYIENMDKVGEWIPCSERLPERDGKYQLKEFEVTVDNGERMYTSHVAYDFHNEKWLVHKKKVIAWKQKCEPYHPVEVIKQTNADRIRSMTDEELKELFMLNIPCDLDENRCNDYHYDDRLDCEKCIMDWIQSESEE